MTVHLPDLLPLSALQHLVYCERQCALIHLEGQWRENPLTFEGREMHERVDREAGESRGDLRVVRGISLVHEGLGLIGRADVVELHRVEDPEDDDGPAARVPGLEGFWRPFPVEYKRGKPKSHDADRVQLCAQALCLEEMWGAPIPRGALFYGKTRRREDVEMDAELRRSTEEACRRLHELIDSRVTPPAVYERAKCRRCSLEPTCQPRATRRSARGYLERVLRDAS